MNDFSNIHSLVKFSIRFVFFFLLFYTEPVIIFNGLTFSQFWKIPLVFISVLYIVANHDKRRLKSLSVRKFVNIGILLSIKNIFTYSTITYLISNLVQTVKILNLPLFIFVFTKYFSRLGDSLHHIRKFTLELSIYCVISGIPFVLGIIKPISSGYDLEIFGSNLDGFVGIFQNPHSASITLAVSTINILFFWKFYSHGLRKALYLIISAIGIFLIYKTFVRTGYITLIIGILILFFSKINTKTIFFLLLLTVGVNFLLKNNQTLSNRIFDNYGNNSDDISRYGSGRLLFASMNLLNWYESEIHLKLFGYGQEEALNKMEEKIGLRIFSHNGFIDVLIQNGILGMIIYIQFLIYFYKITRSNLENNYHILTKASLFMYLTIQLFQGGYFFLVDIFIALNLVSQSLTIDKEKTFVGKNNILL